MRLIIGRLLTGLGIGGLLTLVPLYISETVSAVHRDTYIFLFHAMLSTGVSCAYFIATIVYDEDVIPLDRYSIFCTIAVAVAGFLCAFIPASPLQRVEEDDTAAREAMRRLGGAETGGTQLVDREIELMRQLARALRTTWVGRWREGRCRGRDVEGGTVEDCSVRFAWGERERERAGMTGKRGYVMVGMF